MAEIFNFNLKADEYLDLADKAYKEAEIEKSVAYCSKALETEPKNVEAMLFLASIYSDLGSYELSDRVLYKAYAYSATDMEKTRSVAALVNNFYETGDDEAAEFYLNSISSEWKKFEELSDLEIVGDVDEDYDEKPDFSLVYPKTEDFYYDALERAHDALQDRDYDDALSELSVFAEGAPMYDSACHLKLVCYLLKNDVDRVIYEAGEMLKKTQYLPIKCTLVTAYMLEEKNETALKILDEILVNDYKSVEDITVLLPLLVNFEMHADVVKYTKRLLEKSEFQPQTMMWLSQGLYNLGQRAEAEKMMRKVSVIYRDFTPADFYLRYYATRPEKVTYCLGLPLPELIVRQNKLRKFLMQNDDECRKLLTYDKDTADILKWCFKDIDGKSLLTVADKLNDCWCGTVEEIYIETLLTKDVDIKLASIILEGFARHKSEVKLHITLDGKCKLLYFTVPECLKKLPENFVAAFSTAIYETAVNLDNPSESVAKITGFVNSFCTLNEQGELKWLIPRGDRAAHFRSAPALLGVFVQVAAFADDNEIDSICDFYGISPMTFKKYSRILNGETK